MSLDPSLPSLPDNDQRLLIKADWKESSLVLWVSRFFSVLTGIFELIFQRSRLKQKTPGRFFPPGVHFSRLDQTIRAGSRGVRGR
jgi:hypothetical protein